MSSKSVLALAAIAALGTTCLAPTDASAFDQNQKKDPQQRIKDPSLDLMKDPPRSAKLLHVCSNQKI